MASDQNLNVPGVDHRRQGNNDEGMSSAYVANNSATFIVDSLGSSPYTRKSLSFSLSVKPHSVGTS